MKRFTFFLAAMLLLSSVFSQTTIDLTFTATNGGDYAQLDSIKVMNQTQGGDTVLYYPDTVLSFVVTGIKEIITQENGIQLFQNYPNPFNGKTEFNLYLPENEYIKIFVWDILGRNLIQYENQLIRGNHSFAFYSGNKKYYLLTVIGKRAIKTIKMFNTNSISSYGGKCKIVYNKYEDKIIDLKSTKAVSDFGYNLGDELMFTAYALTAIGNLGSSVIVDIPEMDTIYEFDIIGGLRCPGKPTITDVDGNTYYTVQIGSQCWMKENLKTTSYRNSTPIPNITDGASWSNLTTGAYVWFDNDANQKDLYGALYNWYATIDTNGLCPTKWHMPTSDEWWELTNFIGGLTSPHGNELKSCRQINSPLGGGCNTSDHPRWNENSTHYGTDDYGFSGLPGNSRNIDGSFDQFPVSDAGVWWSSTPYQSEYAWSRVLWYNFGYVDVFASNKPYGFSVRCIKD